MGSPPRMRGKEGRGVSAANLSGITPAYAGKSGPFGRHPGLPPDHPRVCGEKEQWLHHIIVLVGSPPRMRGKVAHSPVRAEGVGITPAYAGKRKKYLTSMMQRRDHPRVCGEKSVMAGNWTAHLGSPPRMRGKALATTGAWCIVRITPAYAGKRLKKSHSTVSPVAIVPLFPSVCNRPVVSNGNPAERDAPLFLPAENTVPASPAYNLRSS